MIDDMIDEATVQALRRHWDEGWNGYDLDTIVAPFAPDIVFSSPFVTRFTGGDTTTIEGFDAVRAYVADSLRRAPGISYTVDGMYVGTDSIVLAYTVHMRDGVDRTGVDSMRLGPDGTVVEWRCHYSFRPEDVQIPLAD